MKKLLKVILICFCFIGFVSCTVDENYRKEYKKQVDEQIDKITETTKIKRDGHTYIIFHNLKESFGVVHDPNCCENEYQYE